MKRYRTSMFLFAFAFAVSGVQAQPPQSTLFEIPPLPPWTPKDNRSIAKCFLTVNNFLTNSETTLYQFAFPNYSLNKVDRSVCVLQQMKAGPPNLYVQHFQNVRIHNLDFCRSKNIGSDTCYAQGWRFCAKPKTLSLLSVQNVDTAFCGRTGKNGCVPCTTSEGDSVFFTDLPR